MRPTSCTFAHSLGDLRQPPPGYEAAASDWPTNGESDLFKLYARRDPDGARRFYEKKACPYVCSIVCVIKFA
jgi:hypothetical protein